MTDHFAEAESYLRKLDDLGTAEAYVSVIAAQAHATLAQGQAAAEMVAMQKSLLAIMVPPSDPTDALPTSPSPEVGVATSPPVASPVDKAWRVGYELGTENTRERITDILEALKPSLITAPEKNAIDKALAAIKADVENTVTGPGFPS